MPCHHRAELQRAKAREADRLRLEKAAAHREELFAEQAAQRAERVAAAAAKREEARLVEHEAATLRAIAHAAAVEKAAVSREAERVQAASTREEERRKQLEDIAAVEQARAAEITSFKAEAAASAKARLARHVRDYHSDADNGQADKTRGFSSSPTCGDGEQAGSAGEAKLRDLERRLAQPPVRRPSTSIILTMERLNKVLRFYIPLRFA